ncbi:MAG: RNA-binding cell elongation regulator Jag/EloR [Candidatus Limnocylindrales bacterium]
MSEYQEFTGKTVEEALRTARESFQVGLDDLDFEILTPGSRGVLGMGAEPARIIAAPRSALGGAAPRREAAAQTPLPPPPPREGGFRDREGGGLREGGDRGGFRDRGGDRGSSRGGSRSFDRGADRGGDRGRRDVPRREVPSVEYGGERAAEAAPTEMAGTEGAERPPRSDSFGGARSDRGRGDRGRRDFGRDRGDRGDGGEVGLRERGGAQLSAGEQEEVRASRARLSVEREEIQAAEASPDALAAGRDILQELLQHMGLDAEVTVETGDTSKLDVRGQEHEKESLGALIGRKGERLSALQHLVNLMLSRRLGEWTRVLVDVEDYRGRRERQLREIATRAAERVQESGKMLQLEPMPALERRWIHLALREHPEVATQSIGEEPHRRVVILKRQSQQA